ncbi:hypothetical protein [Streptomyces sp. WMMC897]|uniref:hypothetical protein n=1 Tax=Streptomyces sp. WMMC897 TaxID=3014782 RepID=UPI0022B71667|nr:hypothetical protein [Streptomyces sp. WMMC897]MCZ7413121.1 hypothetical protein [Streptomyces sp. WMMC897]MCZ7415495.1 hypothetical protein [Streptomyces sp. WMMC897]
MTTEQDIADIRKQGDLKEFLQMLTTQAKNECARRRALVLRHPDLAAKLTEAPHCWTTPERWNGYIPPDTWNGGPNRTPARVALLELVTEAEQRAQPGRAAA